MTAIRSFILLALFCLIFNSIIFGGDYNYTYVDNSEPITMGNVCSNATGYDGKMVIISGVYKRIFHGSTIEGPESCDKCDINYHLASDYKCEKSVDKIYSSLLKKDPYGRVDVIVRGVFRVAKKVECFGQICARYDFEAIEMLSAMRNS